MNFVVVAHKDAKFRTRSRSRDFSRPNFHGLGLGLVGPGLGLGLGLVGSGLGANHPGIGGDGPPHYF